MTKLKVTTKTPVKKWPVKVKLKPAKKEKKYLT